MRELLPKDKIFLKIDEKMKTGCKSGTKEFYLGHGCRSIRKIHRQQKTVLPQECVGLKFTANKNVQLC